ncbi:MAG TPA: hypothetical protein VGG71_06350, partial [Chitinophagaceae bacterium]
MIAYNRKSLDNLFVREQSEQAFKAGCISPEENTKIRDGHPVDFYSPNVFVCIGLFVLTLVISAFNFGLFGLLIGNMGSLFGLMFFFSLISYGALELFVHRGHYTSGIDGALQWMSVAFLYTAIIWNFQMTASSVCLFLFTISLFFTLRFANRIMALLA